MPYSRQTLQNIYLSLPRDLKEALFSVENAEKIQQIARRYQIPIGRIPLLADVTGHVILSILVMEKFISSLQTNLNIDRITAEKIAKDIKQEIFQPIIANLTRTQQESSHKSVPKTTASKSTPPQKAKNENIVDLKNLPRE